MNFLGSAILTLSPGCMRAHGIFSIVNFLSIPVQGFLPRGRVGSVGRADRPLFNRR